MFVLQFSKESYALPMGLLKFYIFADTGFLYCEVAGSEDSNVYFYDLTRPKHICVNKLQVLLSSTSG